MTTYDVIIAGAGISGLLLASELSGQCSVCVLEQSPLVPRQKYWLTDAHCLSTGQIDAEIRSCVGRPCSGMDFIAFDGTKAHLAYDMLLWDTDLLTEALLKRLKSRGGELQTGRCFYSFSEEKGCLRVKASNDVYQCRLLIDCMGFSSPIAAAFKTLKILGFYLVHGYPVRLTQEVTPVGLHNVQMQKRPTYFELFPAGDGYAHAATIISVQKFVSQHSLAEDLNFVLKSADYIDYIEELDSPKVYSGTIPVGEPVRRALDRVYFYGEAAQINPAASATGLTRMLASYKSVSAKLVECLACDQLGARSLLKNSPQSMSSVHVSFQQRLYSAMLRYTSVDFKLFVEDMQKHPDELVGRLVFGDDPTHGFGLAALAKEWMRNPNSILTSTMVRAALARRD